VDEANHSALFNVEITYAYSFISFPMLSWHETKCRITNYIFAFDNTFIITMDLCMKFRGCSSVFITIPRRCVSRISVKTFSLVAFLWFHTKSAGLVCECYWHL
jgi:hypothetical protein